MIESHFYFAVSVGALVCFAGLLLTTLGSAGWTLATVGVLIAGTAVVSRFRPVLWHALVSISANK